MRLSAVLCVFVLAAAPHAAAGQAPADVAAAPAQLIGHAIELMTANDFIVTRVEAMHVEGVFTKSKWSDDNQQLVGHVYVMPTAGTGSRVLVVTEARKGVPVGGALPSSERVSENAKGGGALAFKAMQVVAAGLTR